MPVSDGNEYARIPVCAVHSLGGEELADVSLYLSGKDGAEPVLYRQGDCQASLPDIETLRANGVGSVCVKSADLDRCARVLETKLAELVRREDISAEQKSELVHHVGTEVVCALTEVSTIPTELARADNVVQSIIAAVLSDAGVATSLLRISEHGAGIASHMFAVAACAVMLGARVVGSDPERLRQLGLAGMTHDLGKLGIDRGILNKRGPLNGEEARLMQQHPIESVRLLGDDPAATPLVRQAILQHHERLDGRGYPIGLRGSDLLVESRILSIVDCFHALMGRRDDRDPLKPTEANEILLRQSARQFDPDILRVWIELFNDYRADAVAPGFVEPVGAGTIDDACAHGDHNAMRPVDRAITNRQIRQRCKRRTVVAYTYVGRLGHWIPDRSTFQATVGDLSRNGVGLRIDHAVYRGELLNVQLPCGSRSSVWVRAAVAWCRRSDAGGFLAGMRFLKRIPVRAVRAIGHPVSSFDLSAPVVVSDSVSDDGEVIAQEAAPLETTRTEEIPEHPLAVLERARDGREITRRDAASIIELSRTSDPELRWLSVDAIARIDTAVGRSALLTLLRDPDDGVRERAAAVVVACGMEDMHHALRPLLDDPVSSVALTAATALATYGNKAAVRALVRALHEEGPRARKAAALLGRVFGQRFPANAEGLKSARRYIDARKLKAGG